MKVPKTVHDWLSKVDPERFDPEGYAQKQRDDILRRVEGTSEEKLDEASERKLKVVRLG